MKKHRGTLRSTIIAATVAITGPNSNGHAAEESDWRVETVTDRMTADPVWFAVSEDVAPEERLGWRFNDMASYVFFGCAEEETWASIDFSTERPNLRKSKAAMTDGPIGELLKVFGLDRIISVRTRWDDTSLDMMLLQHPDDSRLDFVDDEEAVRLLKRARTFLVEFHWRNGEVSYFRHSLTGSRAAIERAERKCKAQHKAEQARAQQRHEAAQSATGVATESPNHGEETDTVARERTEKTKTPQPALKAAETAIAALGADNQAWIEASCSRELGPAFWTGCVEREVEAINAGMPNISELATGDQSWIQASCSRNLGPAFWRDCVNRELEAIEAGMPDISDLAADDQAWIHVSCSRMLGPAFWASCVAREAETFRTRR